VFSNVMRLKYVRAWATGNGPLNRDASTRSISTPPSLLLNKTTTTYLFCLQLNIETPTILSPNSGKDKGEWITPVRVIIHASIRQGKS